MAVTMTAEENLNDIPFEFLLTLTQNPEGGKIARNQEIARKRQRYI